MSPGDIARGSKELVDFERASLAGWSSAAGDEKEYVRTVIRAALLRLLETDSWLPGSVQIVASRLDVRIAIEFDADREVLLALARQELAAEQARTKARLVALMHELGGSDVTT